MLSMLILTPFARDMRRPVIKALGMGSGPAVPVPSLLSCVAP
jgi:hypothetical protein